MKRMIVWIVLLALVGCDGIAPSVVLKTTNESLLITGSVTQRDIQRVLTQFFAQSNPPWMVDAIIDFRPGQIVFGGNLYDSKNGSKTPVGIVIQPLVANGQFTFRLDALSVGGWTASVNDIAKINQGIADQAAKTPKPAPGSAQLDAIIVTDSTFSIRIRAPRGSSAINGTFTVRETPTNSILRISLSAAELSALLGSMPGTDGQPLIQSPIVILNANNNEVSLSGFIKSNTSAERVSAGITFAPTVKNGQFSLVVKSVRYGLWNASPADLNQINQGVATSLASYARQNPRSAQISSVSIASNALALEISTPKK